LLAGAFFTTISRLALSSIDRPSILSRGSSQKGAARFVEQEHMPPAHAAVGDRATWHAHWAAQGQPWRAEPEIDAERRRFLAERRSIEPDIAQGIYPFKDIALTRADVEWLLATHEDKDKQGPVDATDLKLTLYWGSSAPSVQEQRIGLDLRGADLTGQDLSGLPLARIRGSLARGEYPSFDEAGRQAEADARTRLAQATLRGSDLRQALLMGATMDEADLEGAKLAEALLDDARLPRANLTGSDLQRAGIIGAHLDGATITGADLTQARLQGAEGAGVSLAGAVLRETNLSNARLPDAHCERADLRGASLYLAQLARARLDDATLDGATVAETSFAGAWLVRASLRGINGKNPF
jgi:uncharacterized protein YjbI with pentapeptide repeats